MAGLTNLHQLDIFLRITGFGDEFFHSMQMGSNPTLGKINPPCSINPTLSSETSTPQTQPSIPREMLPHNIGIITSV